MADVKSLLKEARKLVDEKNYKEATECCKSILRKDKQNYLALVLLGKSLQDSDQAPLAYQKAIASKPDQLLAWQGLANYYERKNDESRSKLFSIYNEILKLQIDEEKAIEIVNKLGQLGCLLKNNEAQSSLVNFLDKKPNENVYKAVETQLLQLVKAGIPCKEDDIPKLVEFIQHLNNYGMDENLYILLGQIILSKKNLTSAFEEILKLDIFPASVMFREWLCKYICTYFVQEHFFSNMNIITQYYNDITVGIENSKYPGLLKSMILFNEGLYLDAYKMCVPLINFHEADITEATFVIKCTVMLKRWSVTQKLASNFLMKSKNQDFVIVLKKFLFLSLTEQHKWKQAIQVANDIPHSALDDSEKAALARCYIEINENVENVLQNVESTDYHVQLKVLTLMKQNKYAEIIELLEKQEENSSNLFSMGKAYWELKQYDKSLVYLLKAAKLDADHADTFLYLGMFYQQYKKDYEKAKKCYEKAYSLNNCDINTVKSLSSVYIKLQLLDADFDLLTKTLQNIEDDTSWINFRLGLHCLRKRQWENAIMRFRDVIKHNHNDATAFECLADAYYSRGSYTSALKAYNKVIALDSTKSVHCLTRIGLIHSLLTSYEDALLTFQKVLEIDSGSLITLKGIAETWIRIAKKKFAAKLYGSARDAAQNAINYLTDALTKEKKHLCFWNLLADILIVITKLPNKYYYVYIKNIIHDNSEEIVKKETLDIFPLAISCYSLIAKQKQQVESYDLAKTYLDYFLASNDLVNCHIAYRLTIACIKKKPTVWRHWNLLGKICMYLKKYALAQHCFIKALLLTRKWSVAKIWCNLGTLYVKMKGYKLANYCFWRGQSTLPSYPHSWIGQALIAEAIQEEEAMDLFRHASRLGYHPESTLGYADWVCRTLKNIKCSDSETKYVIDGLYAIPYAMDLVNWFLSFEPNDSYANNVVGILQERSGLLHSALQSYEKALNYVDDSNRNIVLLNTGRIYLRLERYDDAIKTYKAITEGSLNSACGLALALLKKCDYEEAYSVYDTAFQWLCNDDEEKADILVAMAGIYYNFKGADMAKTLLFRSIQVSQQKPTAYSLFAICSFGIVHSDQSLSRLALSELVKYEKDFGFDIGFLKSFLFFNSDLKLSIKTISNSIYEHPNNAFLWYCMAQYCLNSNDTTKIASVCAQRALCSENLNEYNIHPAKMLSTAGIAEHSVGDILKAFSLAKKGIHMHPLHSDVWALLIFTMTKKIKENKAWVLKTANFMRKQLKVSRNLSRWINLLEKKLTKQAS